MNRTLLASLSFVLLVPALAPLAAESSAPAEKSRMSLVLKIDGATEEIEITDPHALAVGESRTFTTDSGKSVLATRTEDGLELEVDGKTITVPQPPLPDGEGNVMVFHKKVEIEGEDGATKTMVWHGGLPGPMVVAEAEGEPGEGHAFAFHSGDGPLHLPLSAEEWIARLADSPKFQELDEATREKVFAALREVAPEAKGLRKTVVLEVRDEVEDEAEAPAD